MRPLTWIDLKRTAYGELGLHPWEFKRYSLAEFVLKREGFNRAEIIRWHHTRLIAFTIAKPYLKNKNLKIEAFLPLPDDKSYREKSLRDMNVEERRKHIKELREATYKHFGINAN